MNSMIRTAVRSGCKSQMTPVIQRYDIYYDMLTGKRAFEGEDVTPNGMSRKVADLIPLGI